MDILRDPLWNNIRLDPLALALLDTDVVQRLRYVFLTPDEEVMLRALEARGLAVTAQDVPSTRPVPLADVLAGKPDA